MIRATIMLFFLNILFPGSAYSSISAMNLMGKGEVYYLGFIKVYDAWLYANSATTSEEILHPETSRCLKLTYDVSLEVKDFIRGAETILARQHSPEEIAKWRKEIDMVHTAYQDVEKGDSYYLCYDAPQRLTTLTLNDKQLVAVPSREFADIYFGIWLGEVQPLDEKLRNQLLRIAR